ncbi:[FeFe] hydrogenase, group A [Clostridium sp. BJN0001]|uniref:[FeFe] hydrogenase, group A n=1 Tax=Clostridium sp. BJN0001 TaxID=2930219 RepID=UPI001FCFD0A8|nr:[FeFe] hydrogenase, group A [Clostridium sp. BJN0001]
MSDKNDMLIKNRFGFAFSELKDDSTEKTSSEKEMKIAVYGRVNKPGIIKFIPNMTLSQIIDSVGGISDKNEFKAAQINMPIGKLILKNDINKEIKADLFNKSEEKSIIILSKQDCIVQYALYYIEYLIEKINEGLYKKYEEVKDDIIRIYNILDRISKGAANMRDLYCLRILSNSIKEKMNEEYSVIEDILENFYSEMEEHIKEKKCYTYQCNNLVKITITQKCIGCGSCKRVCPVDCIDGEIKKKHNIDHTRCTYCGACISACPVDAITSGSNTLKFLRDLSLKDNVVVTQMAPAIRVTIGEAFGFKPGDNVEGKVCAALKKLGVNYVFDTTYGADLTIMEESAELVERFKKYISGDKNVKLPILTSCCPAWINFIEENYRDMMDVPSTAKSPMEMVATVIKEIWARENKISRDKLVSVAIMPCVAKKYEASREQFSMDLNYDVDYVVTTRELIKLFKDFNIDLKNIEPEKIDKVIGEYSGAGIIFGRTGGVIEAAVRTAYQNITGKKIDVIKFEPLRGWDNFRVCNLDIEGVKLKIGIVYGLKEAKKLLDKIRSGEEFFHAIEIMACQYGCVGGGGQPKVIKNKENVLKSRAEGLNNIDENMQIRRSNENSQVRIIYKKYLECPLSKKARELFHTNYFSR